jgi:hypothetical protein
MTAAKIGVDLTIFEILAASDEPQTTVDLAVAMSMEPDFLLRLLKFIASIGLIKELQANLWGPSNATKNLADRNIAAGVNHKYVASMYILKGISSHGDGCTNRST